MCFVYAFVLVDLGAYVYVFEVCLGCLSRGLADLDFTFVMICVCRVFKPCTVDGVGVNLWSFALLCSDSLCGV